jgi:hypothetical protein
MDFQDYAQQVRAAYDVYCLALTGAYLGLKSAGRGQDAVSELRGTGLGLLQTLMNSASSMSARYLTNLPAGTQENARATGFLDELRRIATKNLNDTIVRLIGTGIDMVSSARPADLLNRPAGAVGLLLQERMSRPRFTARDTAGRAWDAGKLVSLLARDFAYQSYIDAMLAQQAAAGATLVDIVYADPARNLTLTLAQVAEQRQAIFHINATAQVRTHVSTHSAL